MTNDNINQVSKPTQEADNDLLARIATLDAELIAIKLEMRERARKEAIQTGEETETPEVFIYAFTKDEVLAINALLEASIELLTVTDQITARITKHLDEDEHKNILTLQTNIRRVYNNYNVHLPSVTTFEKWIRENAVS